MSTTFQVQEHDDRIPTDEEILLERWAKLLVKFDAYQLRLATASTKSTLWDIHRMMHSSRTPRCQADVQILQVLQELAADHSNVDKIPAMTELLSKRMKIYSAWLDERFGWMDCDDL